MSKRVDSEKAVIRHYVRNEEAHTRSRGAHGHAGLRSRKIESTGQYHLIANGVVVAVTGDYMLVDPNGTKTWGTQVMVHRDTKVVGELVAELKRQKFYKAVASPVGDVWFKDREHE